MNISMSIIWLWIVSTTAIFLLVGIIDLVWSSLKNK